MRAAFAAWLLTGPLGHLAGGAADWAALAVRLGRARLRRRRRATALR
jgi:hypothetical protein